MNLSKFFIVLCCISFPFFSSGQIRFSETIQTSKTATNTEASLFFIDFWATWCGPCVYASEYLGVLQKQYPDRFYVVSLSEENPEVVKRFLKKNPTDLAVAIDYKGETFRANNTRTLPYGLLLNANGTVLWKGSPTDFKQAHLERFLKQNTKQKDVSKVLKIQKVKEEVFKADYIPSKTFEIKELKHETFETLESVSRGDYLVYKGDLKSIIAKEKRILKSQIQIAPELNKTYEVYIKKGSSSLFMILEELKLDLFHSEIQGEVLMLDLSNMTYWDTHQIDWGKNTANYLVDDTQIQADNVTFEDVMYQLASVLNIPIVTSGGTADQEVHDWQIHHRFYNLMQTDLEDTYGIVARKEQGNYKTYTIRKKTP
ncbi:TlpA disulfide reductase family protein [Psychroserpens sp. SPM9]|uniref:TlpA family protein disulfide reductase n=1 Tax=Psychroserpens sp. SPM9 TaxID=2975598 RepID=UPI0021A96091|nr:TlpA disulfide reductase family protein [Psychroserpens sp. SPM9]MDG5492572.1 TlpA disulfide reductase family protein [Psychroserpens sp. SPM9]